MQASGSITLSAYGFHSVSSHNRFVFHIPSRKSRKGMMSTGERWWHAYWFFPSAALQGSVLVCHLLWLSHSGASLSCPNPMASCIPVPFLTSVSSWGCGSAGEQLSWRDRTGSAIPVSPQGRLLLETWPVLLGLLQHREVLKILLLSCFTQPHGVCDTVDSSFPQIRLPFISRNKCHQQ